MRRSNRYYGKTSDEGRAGFTAMLSVHYFQIGLVWHSIPKAEQQVTKRKITNLMQPITVMKWFKYERGCVWAAEFFFLLAFATKQSTLKCSFMAELLHEVGTGTQLLCPLGSWEKVTSTSWSTAAAPALCDSVLLHCLTARNLSFFWFNFIITLLMKCFCCFLFGKSMV